MCACAPRGMTVNGAAAAELVHLERRPRPQPLQRRVAVLAVQRRHAHLAPVLLVVERRRARAHRGQQARAARRRRRSRRLRPSRPVHGSSRRARRARGSGSAPRRRACPSAGRSPGPPRRAPARAGPWRRSRSTARRAATSRRRRRRRDRRRAPRGAPRGSARQARAPDLLLALDQEADVQRQRARLRVEGLRGLERDDDRALVVGRAARVDAPVAHVSARTAASSTPLSSPAAARRSGRRRGSSALRARSEPLGEHDGMACRLHHPPARERELTGRPTPPRAASRPRAVRIAADARDLEERARARGRTARARQKMECPPSIEITCPSPTTTPPRRRRARRSRCPRASRAGASRSTSSSRCCPSSP